MECCVVPDGYQTVGQRSIAEKSGSGGCLVAECSRYLPGMVTVSIADVDIVAFMVP
jgi:hypothetical protein